MKVIVSISFGPTSIYPGAMFSTWAVIRRHLFLSLALWISCPAVMFSSISSRILSTYFFLCRPLDLFPSIIPVRHRCSIFSLLITCPRNSICLFLITLSNVLCRFTLLRTSSFGAFVVWSVENLWFRSEAGSRWVGSNPTYDCTWARYSRRC